METLTLLLLVAHVILYLAWKMTALDEKNSRPDGHDIPTYATGGLGNLIGFSLLTTGVSLNAENFFGHPGLWGVAAVSVFITLLLHVYWKRSVLGTTASLYMSDGSTTLAGALHLIYVVFISFMVLLFLMHINQVDLLELGLFGAGIVLYASAIAIDRWRGVI